MNSNKVCAILVTYNRKELLIECLNGLLKQTIPLNGIYLVDNASKDGTLEKLKENGILDTIEINTNQEYYRELKINDIANIKFYYLRLSENTGGAGGFYEGMKNAYSKGFDWYWLMDDDVEPLNNALETQLRYKDISQCIHPGKIYLNGDRYIWEGCLNELDGFEYFKDDEFLKYFRTFVPVNIGNFEGMLINKEIVKNIGFPKKELFMIGDDTIYGYNASKYTLNIYIKEICFIKKIDNRGKYTSVLKRYLTFRNKYASFSRKIARNKFYWLISFLIITVRKLGSSLIKRRNPREFYYIIRGILDGLLENYSMNIVRKLTN